MYMPCYTKDIIGTKILSIFPENSKLGLPSIDGIVLLNDHTTGAPLAVMDGQSVTAWRTGAVGGVGIRHLSRKDCHTVGIIGAGMQGFHQAVYACAARDIHTVYVFNHSDRDLTDYLEFGTEEVPVIGQFGPVKVKDEKTGKEKVLMQRENRVYLKDSAMVDGSLVTELTTGRNGTNIRLADRMKALQWLSDHVSHEVEETADDGFLEALKGSAAEDWSDEEEYAVFSFPAVFQKTAYGLELVVRYISS